MSKAAVSIQESDSATNAVKTSIARPRSSSSLLPSTRSPLVAGSQSISNVSKPLIQPKLKIGAPDDKYEQEADRVADQVLRIPEGQILSTGREVSNMSADHSVQRLCTECKGELNEEADIQRKASPGQAPAVTPDIASGMQSLRASGRPLSQSDRHFFEPRIGADFSRVRVHNDTKAASLAQSINARAFTLGHDVVFGEGRYSPGTTDGRRLMAHELTHVVQQGGGKVRSLNRAQSGLPCRRFVDYSRCGRDRIQRVPEVDARPASSSVGRIDHSKTSVELGAMAGGPVAYGLSDHSITMSTHPDTRPRRNGGQHQVALWRVQFFPNVDTTIYVASDFPAGGCIYNKIFSHEVGHVFDAYAVMSRQREVLQSDLLAVTPEPDSPFVTNSIPAARRRRQQIRNRVSLLANCAKSQACFDLIRVNRRRDIQEYPTSFQGCPSPHPPTPQVPPAASVVVNCGPPPRGCPRPINGFP